MSDLAADITAETEQSERRGPLAGVTVLDLTRVLAGPYCTMMLSDLGARVIKVEPPKGDDAREYGPWLNGQSAYFMSLNRGKESIALNLKDEADRAVFEKLLARTDVLVENFRPGTMARFGFGWEDLRNRFPKLIYAACSGFGQTGPLAQRPSYDMVVQGMGGIMSVTGHKDAPPTRVGTSIGDIGAGLYTTIAVNAALYDRAQTGRGQFIDVAMLDCQIALLENAIVRYFTTGNVPGPVGARHPLIAPFECYESGDGHIIISAGNDSLFVTLCEALGRADMAADPRYKTNQDRMDHVDELKAEMESVLKTNTTDHWIELLSAGGVPCGPLNDIARSVENPQVAARNMIVGIDDPAATDIKIAGSPLKFSAYDDPPKKGPVPALDGHRDKIVKELE